MGLWVTSGHNLGSLVDIIYIMASMLELRERSVNGVWNLKTLDYLVNHSLLG